MNEYRKACIVIVVIMAMITMYGLHIGELRFPIVFGFYASIPLFAMAVERWQNLRSREDNA